MNTELLKSIIVLNKDTQGELANYLDITQGTLSFKITGKTDFTRSEIKMIKDRYNLTAEQVNEIFFN
jgi:hypothetical protein